MNDLLINRYNMIGACISVARRPEFSAVWTGNAPLDFEDDLDALEAKYTATAAVASQYNSAITGAADAKDLAEDALEEATFTLARALANHFKKTGDLTNRAKVNVRMGAIQKLRDQTLSTFGAEVLALATVAATDAEAVNRGVTTVRITELTNAVSAFNALMPTPRGNIVSKAALGAELKTRVAELMEDVADLDDLVAQFNNTPAGRTFIQAWKQARVIVDAGHGPGEPEEEPAPVVPTPA